MSFYLIPNSLFIVIDMAYSGNAKKCFINIIVFTMFLLNRFDWEGEQAGAQRD